MFDFDADRGFTGQLSVTIVASTELHQRAEARQRDIYESHRHRTFALAYYMTGNELEAEDILANTFLKAFRAPDEPTGEDIDLTLLEELRQRIDFGVTAVSPPPSEADDQASATQLTERNVKRTDLEESVQALPSHERLLFLLRDVEGYTPAAIAQLLQIPQSQVQRDLFIARLRLRQLLAGAPAKSKVA